MLLPKRIPKKNNNSEELHNDFLNHEQKIEEKIVVLDDKVDEFINWYFENMVKENYTSIGEFNKPIAMRNFIEKMAVWYELRYPDSEINTLTLDFNQEQIDINEIIFHNNQDKSANDDTNNSDKNTFYDIREFIDLLSWKEKYLLLYPKYPQVVYWSHNSKTPCLYLTSDGFVEKAEDMDDIISGISSDNIEGMHIKEVVKMIKDSGIKLPEECEFEKAIKDYETKKYQRENMLDCVMYRIIERGENRFGPRRAFLFAKEFERNIDIPMMYGVDCSDPSLRLFINDYIKVGGSKDLVCYIGYGSRTNKYEKLQTITIQELIKIQNHNAATFYTPEEDELHQRLVDLLNSNINQEELKKEQDNLKNIKVKSLRIHGKLEKSQKNYKKL